MKIQYYLNLSISKLISCSGDKYKFFETFHLNLCIRLKCLNRKTVSKEVKLIKSIEKTIDNRDYEWKVSRITMDGKVKFE